MALVWSKSMKSASPFEEDRVSSGDICRPLGKLGCDSNMDMIALLDGSQRDLHKLKMSSFVVGDPGLFEANLASPTFSGHVHVNDHCHMLSSSSVGYDLTLSDAPSSTSSPPAFLALSPIFIVSIRPVQGPL